MLSRVRVVIMLNEPAFPMFLNKARKTSCVMTVQNVELEESLPVEVSKRSPKLCPSWKEKILIEAKGMRSSRQNMTLHAKPSKSLGQYHSDSHVLVMKNLHDLGRASCRE